MLVVSLSVSRFCHSSDLISLIIFDDVLTSNPNVLLETFLDELRRVSKDQTSKQNLAIRIQSQKQRIGYGIVVATVQFQVHYI